VIIERGGNLMTVVHLLGERTFREQIVATIADPVVRSFWLHEFASWYDSYRTETVAAFQTELLPFLTSMHSDVRQSSCSFNLSEGA
jgi:hypothetical protein